MEWTYLEPETLAPEALDEAEALLRQMLALALRSAGDGCGDGERAALQREFDALRRALDRVADRAHYEGAPVWED